MLRKFIRRGSYRGAGDRRIDGVRHQEVRAHERRRSERQGRLAGPIARGDAGAHAPERGAHLRGRSEGGRRRRRRPRQAQRAAADAANTRHNAANSATAADGKADTLDKASQAAGLRGRAERGPGQLQVRQEGPAGRGQGPARRDGRADEGRTRRASTSKSKATPTTSATR